jgi:hypothetical protein
VLAIETEKNNADFKICDVCGACKNSVKMARNFEKAKRLQITGKSRGTEI